MAGATKLITPSGGGVLITPNANISSDITLNLPTSGVNGGTLVSTNSNGAALMPGSAVFNTLGVSGTGSSAYIRSLNGFSTETTPDYTWWNEDQTGLFHPAASVIGFTVAGSEKARVNSSGQLCIGTTTGSGKLNINTGGTTRAVASYVTVTASPSSVDNEEVFTITNNTAISGLTFSGVDRRLLTFGVGTNNTVYMRAAFPSIITDNSFRIQDGSSNVVFATFSGNNTQIYNDRAGDWNNRILMLQCNNGAQPGIGFHAQGSSAAGILKFYGPGARFEFRSSTDLGFLDAWANTFVNTSDYRLKENVIPVENGIDKIKLLKPCSFIWKQTGDAGTGFIAHELQEVIPQAVHGEKDAVQEDNQPEYQGINIDAVVSVLTKAVQEQQEKIEQLELEVAALKGAK